MEVEIDSVLVNGRSLAEAADEHRPWLLRRLALVVGDATEAEDLSQQALLRLLERWPLPSGHDVARWLAVVGMRLAIDEQRRRRRWGFLAIGTSFYTVEPGNVRDFSGIRVLFKGPDASAAAAVEAHFGNPPWLRAIWYGPEEWTGARGDLVIFARDAAGRPVAGLTIGLVSLDERVRSGELAWMTNKDGRRILVKNLPAVSFLVRAQDYVGGELVVLGKARVQIAPDGRTTVTVIIK